MDNKSIVFSKTMWYNLVWIMLLVINHFFLPVPIELLEPLAAVSLPLGNMVLRAITTKGVSVWG